MSNQTLLDRATDAHQTGRLDEAELLFRQILEQEPDNAEVIYGLGVIRLQRGQYLDAIPFLERSVNLEPSPSLQHLSLAYALEKLGKLSEAEGHLHAAVGIEPGHAEAWNYLGNVLVAQGRLEEACEAYRQAVRSKSNYIDAHHNLGRISQHLGRYGEAEAAFQQAIVLQPANTDRLKELAMLYVAWRRPDKAVAAYQAVLARRPDDFDACYHIGALLLLMEDAEHALPALEKAAALKPSDFTTRLALGRAYRLEKRFDEALAALDVARQGMPDEWKVFHEIGYTLQQMERYEESIKAYRKAIELAPDSALTHGNLGLVHSYTREYDLAIAESLEAIRLNPGLAFPYGNLGNIYKSLGQVDKALACYRQALARLPDDQSLRFALGFTLLAAGRFAEGWQYYTSRPTMVDRKDVMIPDRPLPEELTGKRILLVLDQGIGDEIFFLRFAYELKRRGAFLMYRPYKKTASLVARLHIIDHLVPKDEPPSEVDYAYSVGDLPLALGMKDASEVPPSIRIPILPAAMKRVHARLAETGPGPYLGITWRAGIPKEQAIHYKKGKSLYKETPLEELARIARQWPGQVLVLQRLPKDGEVEEFARLAGRPVQDFTDLNDDLEQMLALMAEIDEYVGVSNTNMHLRAAVGRTCRVLVPNPPDWRWMISGTESPWFPGFTVYREEALGGWSSAFERLEREMHDAWTLEGEFPR